MDKKIHVPSRHLKIESVTLTPTTERAGYEINRDSDDHFWYDYDNPYSNAPIHMETTALFNLRDWELTEKREPSKKWKKIRAVLGSDMLTEQVLDALEGDE